MRVQTGETLAPLVRLQCELLGGADASKRGATSAGFGS
jgi:hypothetical protein